MFSARRLAVAASVGGTAAAAALTLRGGASDAPWSWIRSSGPPTALAPGRSLMCPLESQQWVSPDTLQLRFGLPTPEHVLGLPVPGHLVAIDNAMIYRPYSPVTVDSLASGYFDLLIRRYPGGEISSYLARLKPGDRVHFRGPVASRFEYRRGAAKRLGLVAAGTGITPMWQAARTAPCAHHKAPARTSLAPATHACTSHAGPDFQLLPSASRQIIQTVLADPTDDTCISLLYASRSAEDILLKQELDEAATRHPGRLRVCYVVSAPAASAEGDSGLEATKMGRRIDAALLRDQMPAADADGCQLLVCGPEGLVRTLCGARAQDGGANGADGVGATAPLGGLLKQLGYRDEQVAWL